jgi:hypothetical protein
VCNVMTTDLQQSVSTLLLFWVAVGILSTVIMRLLKMNGRPIY